MKKGAYDPIFNIGDIHDSAEDPYRGLAVYVEHAGLGDPTLMKALVDQFVENIWHLSHAILDTNWSEPVDEAEILKCVVDTFSQAVGNPSDFQNQETVQEWLYAITIRKARTQTRSQRWRKLIKGGGKYLRKSALPEYHQSPGSVITKPYSRVTGQLNFNQRSTFILKYIFNLSLSEIGRILGINREKATSYLEKTLSVINELVLNSPESSELVGELQSRWLDQTVDKTRIVNLVYAKLATDTRRRNVQVILKRSRDLWLLAIITCAILIGLSTLSRLDRSDSRPLFPPTLAPPPRPLNATSVHTILVETPAQLDPEDLSRVLFIAEPDITSDGNLLAFTSSINTLTKNDNNRSSDIYVLNIREKKLQLVSVNSEGEHGNAASRSPDISPDGRYIVFSSLADNLVPGDFLNCMSLGLETNCSDIFLRDLWTGKTERINLAFVGQEANGHSHTPSISPDARWVVYWSEATNLVSEHLDSCKNTNPERVCLDVYIYDRETGRTEGVYIGRDYRQAMPQRLTISRDGRYLAITIFKSDLIARKLQLERFSQAFIYDLAVRQFIPLNHTRDGKPGIGASYHVQISADGGKATFVSRADNLIDTDDNNKADVFFYDLIQKKTTLVSADKNGVPGNANSATNTVPGIIGWGQPISLSKDGRFIAYLSLADNLAPQPGVLCGQLGLPVCTHVYVHDREKGTTELLLSGRGRDSFYQDVSISDDGRWVMIVEQLFRCFQGDFCSEIWLIDRHDGNLKLTNPLREILSLERENPEYWPSNTYAHDSMVKSIDFSPDGNSIATGTNDGMIRLWKLAGGEEPPKKLIGHTLPITEIKFTPDGKSLVSSSTDGSVYFWQVNSGSLTGRLIKNSHPITSLTISRDGNLLAAGSVGHAWIWRRESDEIILLDSIEIPGNYINDIDFSPDGQLLALAINDGTSWLYHLDKREVILRLGAHEGKVYALRFSPNGQFIATGSEDRTVNLWKLRKDKDGNFEVNLSHTFQHSNIVRSLEFSPDGHILASASLDKHVNLFQVPNGKILKPPISVYLDEVVSLDFSNDGTTLAAGTIGGDLHLWRINDLDIN